MKKTLLLSIFIFELVAIKVNAQNVVTSAGMEIKSDNIQLSWTIGEPVITTEISTEYILTQGFHQSSLIVTPVILHELNNLLKVYPNPLTQRVFVELDTNRKLAYELYDINGKLLKQNALESVINEINTESLANGTYYLKVSDNQKLIQTYKLIKMD